MSVHRPDPLPPCREVNGQVPSWLELRFSPVWGVNHWFCTVCSMWADDGHINGIKHKHKLNHIFHGEPPVRDSSGRVPVWLVLRPWPDGSCESWYCTLCEAFADSFHLESRKHTSRSKWNMVLQQQRDAASAVGEVTQLYSSNIAAPTWSSSSQPALRSMLVGVQPASGSGQVVLPVAPLGPVQHVPPPPPPVPFSSQQGASKKCVVPKPPPPPSVASSFSGMCTKARMLPPPPHPPPASTSYEVGSGLSLSSLVEASTPVDHVALHFGEGSSSGPEVLSRCTI